LLKAVTFISLVLHNSGNGARSGARSGAGSGAGSGARSCSDGKVM